MLKFSLKIGSCVNSASRCGCVVREAKTPRLLSPSHKGTLKVLALNEQVLEMWL